MATRMQKYYKSDRADANTGSRSSRNKDLYGEIYTGSKYSNIEGIASIDNANEVDITKVKEMLNNDLDNLVARHDEVVGMYEKASSTAPAFGMIGTLVGLINMLKSMNLEDSSGAGSLGASMSVALVTTFYGCILANLIFNPIATKLRIRHSEEELCKTIIIEGVLSIQAGENPKFLREKLISFLPQRQRELASEESGEWYK